MNLWRSSVRPWLWLSIAAAVLAAIGNVVGLVAVDRVYGTAYPSLSDQATAQDLVDLVVVAPAMVIVAGLALRGSVRAYLAWLGPLVFTVYNYVIYVFAVHFGPLFLLWVAVLGLTLYALIGGLAAANADGIQAAYTRHRMRGTAWFLIAVGAAFAGIWLSDIVPALARGTVPSTVTDLGVPTNAVHVLDLSFFLPAVLAVGVLLLLRSGRWPT